MQRFKEAFPPLFTVRLILRSDHHPVDSRKTAHGPFDTLFELLAIETRVLLFGLLLSLRSELFGNRLLGPLFSLAQYETPPISQHVKKIVDNGRIRQIFPNKTRIGGILVACDSANIPAQSLFLEFVKEGLNTSFGFAPSDPQNPTCIVIQNNRGIAMILMDGEFIDGDVSDIAQIECFVATLELGFV